MGLAKLDPLPERRKMQEVGQNHTTPQHGRTG